MTPEATAVLADLRQTGHFDWAVVVELAFVVVVYARAIARGEQRKVVLALGFWGVEFLWEMFNALILTGTQHAALWMVAGRTSFVIYAGLTVEIALMFAVAPLVVLDVLPADRRLRWLGIPARVWIPLGVGLFCVAVETLLWSWGALIWTWWFWGFPNLVLVVGAYCAPFVVLAWIDDRAPQGAIVAGTVATWVLVVLAHLVLAVGLGWI